MIEPHETWDFSSVEHMVGPLSSHDHTSERTELSEWVERVTKQLIDDPDTGSDSEAAMVTDTKPSRRSCFDSNGVINPNPNPNMVHWSNNGALEGNTNKGLSMLDERGLGFLGLLLECAVSISVDNLGEAHRMLLELTQMASPYGLSCAERVVAYFSQAMFGRVINSWLGICAPLVDHKTIHAAFQVLNNVTPFVKFAHFTSNQAILEAVHRQDRVHIVDLDIMQGLQWPALFHILANRAEGPPRVRR